MLKLLNILAVAYLAVAPGMNVEVLIHSVELCRVTHTEAVQAHTCAHHHEEVPREKAPHDEEGCPHLCESVAPANVMPSVQVHTSVKASCPGLAFESVTTVLSTFPPTGVADDPRPPPGLTGTTILIV